MTNWAGLVSPVVQQDVGELLMAATDVAEQMLRAGGDQPFAVLMDHDGGIVARHIFVVPGQDLAEAVTGLTDAIYESAHQLRAVAVVVSCGELAAPQLETFGDHRDGQGFAARVTWAMGQADRGRIEAEPVTQSFFR